MTETADRPIDKGLRVSAWALYGLIVFEILFMVSPFALYYYSIYSIPLNWLQQSSLTAWTTLHILPHFTYTESILSQTLLLASWPLILTGLVMFFWCFAQIYWSKLIGETNVDAGLYRHIRHPQYVALAILGLGTTIYWSRFLVLMAYVSMMFVYYFLARHEEKVCLTKFGNAYRDYQERTGMFLPKQWLTWLPDLEPFLPTGGWRRIAALVVIYTSFVAASIAGGWWVKHRVLDQITIHAADGLTLIALAPTSAATMTEIHSVLDRDPDFRRERERLGLSTLLGYVAPREWNVPELGLRRPGEHRHSGLGELFHPSTHGNSIEIDPHQLVVAVMEPIVIDTTTRAEGKELVMRTLGYVPKLEVVLDLGKGSVTSVSDEPYESQWTGIPVPIY